MLYSVRMRAAQGGAHESGGRHISGAERLVSYRQIAATADSMLERAFSHSRGRPDFINIRIEAIDDAQLTTVPLLPVTQAACQTIEAGRNTARAALARAGIAPAAVEQAFASLLALNDGMRGALLLCLTTGRRIDHSGTRGIRVSCMDIADPHLFELWLRENRLTNIHVREALVLSAKVASAPDIMAELCWSDDPEYTTGYVASKNGYLRIPHLKPLGSPLGGRVFFVRPDCNLEELIHYLEQKPVLVTTSAKGGDSLAVSN